MSRILMVVLSDYLGGMEKHVLELSEHLCARGHSVKLVCGENYPKTEVANLCKHVISSKLSRYNPLLICRIAREILNFSPDIIHCHGTKATFVLGLIPRLGSAKRVATVHGLKKIAGAYRKLDHCIGVSQQITNRLRSEDIATTLVYNGMDLPQDHTRPNDILTPKPNSTFIWALVGRLAKVKGFELAIEALAELDEHAAIIIGEGPEKEALENLVLQLGISHRVQFLGFRNDVPHLLKIANGTLITSHREGFSYVFLESMLCGTPVVATDVPVANEILPKEYICRDRRPSSLAKIMEMVKLKQETEDIQTAEIERCRTSFTLNAMVNNVETVYQTMAGYE
ncbi:MAG TPA: glycosyltransferase [Marinobacterium sp.]|nr:glycosyltransferase [Marinobacterium sp.]